MDILWSNSIGFLVHVLGVDEHDHLGTQRTQGQDVVFIARRSEFLLFAQPGRPSIEAGCAFTLADGRPRIVKPPSYVAACITVSFAGGLMLRA